MAQILHMPDLGLALVASSRLEAAGLHPRCQEGLDYSWLHAPHFWVAVPDVEVEAARAVAVEAGWERWLL